MKSSEGSRVVRIFISSTFRDFMEERDLLVKQVFPELRRRCKERFVELIDVDLRWGITEMDAEQGRVLPICLKEIDRARPYFIGLIGNRYGWVPDVNQYDLGILEEQPWLLEHRGGKSVTELEILHGVLKNPSMAGHAFFYFRDTAYAISKGIDYMPESLEAEQKLLELKQNIRNSGFPIIEDYPTPNALVEIVKRDLWEAISDDYPVVSIPDAQSRDCSVHYVYARSRCRIYLGGLDYFREIDNELYTEHSRPVLITGPSGIGKTALVSNWVETKVRSREDILWIIHYLGAGEDAADPVMMVRRIISQIAFITGDEPESVGDPQQVFEILPVWLAKAGAFALQQNKKCILVVDGVDKTTAFQDMRWWPSVIPPGMKLVVSCLDGMIQDALRIKMDWCVVPVRPLSNPDKIALVKEYLSMYRKSLLPERIERIVNHPLSENPLFLLTLLEELRVFGIHEQIDWKIQFYLAAESIEELFQNVLQRLEQDFGASQVKASLVLIWASRAGLPQDELLAISKLVPAQWAPIHNALDDFMIETGGRLQFAHDYLRNAVACRYLKTEQSRMAAHRRIAMYFEKMTSDVGIPDRVIEELPWQLEKGQEKYKLRALLSDMRVFPRLCQRDKHELLGYWLRIGDDIEASYKQSWEIFVSKVKSEELKVDTAALLSSFLSMAGIVGGFSQSLLTYAIQVKSGIGGDNTPDVMQLKSDLASLYLDRGEFQLAESIYRDVLDEYCNKGAAGNNAIYAEIRNNLGLMLCEQGRIEESEVLVNEAQKEFEALYGKNDVRTITALNNLGLLEERKEAYASAEVKYRAAYETMCMIYGSKHPSTLLCQANIGSMQEMQGGIAQALETYENTLIELGTCLGQDHHLTINVLNNLSCLKYGNGDLDGALVGFERVVKMYKQRLDAKHPRLLKAMDNLGHIYFRQSRYLRAVACFKQSYCGRKEMLGIEHQDTQSSKHNLEIACGTHRRANTLL